MNRSSKPKSPVAPSKRRGGALLSGSALGISVLMSNIASAALPTVPAPADVTFSTGGAAPTFGGGGGAMDVNLNAPRTLINWSTFQLTTGDTVNFKFNASSDIVLNKSAAQIKIEGAAKVTGTVGGVTGGNIWFYSPQGVIVSPTATMTAGGFMFARGDLVDLSGFLTASDPLNFLRGAADSLIRIDTVSATTASIDASGNVVLSAAGDIDAREVLGAGTAKVASATGFVNIDTVTSTGSTAEVTAGDVANVGAISGKTGASITAGGDTLIGLAQTTSSGDVIISSGRQATVGSANAAGDLKINGKAAKLTTGSAGGDLFVTASAGAATVVTSATAGDDVEITAAGGAVVAGGATLKSTGVGATDDAHILAKSITSTVTVGAAVTQGTGVTAGDVIVSAQTTATLGSGDATRDLSVTGKAAKLTTGAAARDLSVTATAGDATVVTSATAGDDIEINAIGGDVLAGGATLKSTGVGAIDDAHILAKSATGAVTVGSAIAQGTGTSIGNVSIDANTSATLGSGDATRDIRVSGRNASLTTGTAARDLFVTATAGDATVVTSATAGDDVEITATGGAVVATGATLKSTGVGATDDAHVFVQSTTGAADVGSAITQGTGAAAGDVTISANAATATLGAGVASQDLKVTGRAAKLTSGSASRDLSMTATNGAATLINSATAGDDVVISASGAVLAGGATLRSTGAGSVGAPGGMGGGYVYVSSANASVDVGLAYTEGTGTAAGDIVVSAATSASLGLGSASRDLKVSGASADLTTGSAARDLFVDASNASANVYNSATAGDDIEITAANGAVNADGATLKSTGVGATDDAHILVKSTTGAVKVGTATTQGTGVAAGDVTLAAAGAATISSALSARDLILKGASLDVANVEAARDLTATASSGQATLAGSIKAGDDIEITATDKILASGATIKSTGVGATDDASLLIKSSGSSVTLGSALTQGTGAAAGDVVVDALTTATVSAVTATRDAKVSGAGGVQVTTATAARDVSLTASSGNVTVVGSATAGDDIEIDANDAVNAGGAILKSIGVGATDDAHILVKSATSSVTVGSAATQGTGVAAGDVTLTGTTVNVATASASRDLLVTATTGDVTIGTSAQAGDDIEVTAATTVNASGATLKSTGVGATDDAHILVKASGSTLAVGSAITQGVGVAAGDVTLEAANGAATVGSATATRDITVSGKSATLTTGSAAHDLFVTAAAGDATVVTSATAGDDVEITATGGAVVATGATLKSTGVGATGDAHVLAKSATSTVTVGAAMTQGTGAASGDVVIDAATTATLGSGSSARDLTVKGAAATLTSGSADRDLFVTATAGDATVVSVATAGDDVEITAAGGAVVATGATLKSTGVGATDDAHVLAKSATSTVTVGTAITQGSGVAAGDVIVDAATTARIETSAAASRDIQVLAGGAVDTTSATLSAEGDIAARSTNGDVVLGSASAGDDLVLRAANGAVTASGDLMAGQTNGTGDASGAGDSLAATTLAGHDIDIQAKSVAVAGDVAAGRKPVAGETLDAAQLGSDVLVSASAADPSAGVAAVRLATGAGKVVRAHQDIDLRTPAAGASILTGGLRAGRDIAVFSAAGDITARDALAGDDIALRALFGKVDVTGDMKTGRDFDGMTSVDAVGAADTLQSSPGMMFKDWDANPATTFSMVGFDVNVAAQAIHVGGTIAAGRQLSTDLPDVAGPVDTSTSDVRLQTLISATSPTTGLAPSIYVGDVIATRDIQIDSAKAVGAGALNAGRDVAVLGRGDTTPGDAPGDHTGAGVTIASMRAGDDALAYSIYGRAKIIGGVRAGAVFSRLAPTTDTSVDGATQAADQLAIYLRYLDLDETSRDYVLSGADIQIVGEGVEIGGPVIATGAGSDIRLRSGLDLSMTGTANAGGDLQFDAATTLAAGDLTAGGDIALVARGGALNLASAKAGDDVVIRGVGDVTVTGTLTATGGADAAGAGDLLFGASKSVLSGDLSLNGKTVDVRSKSGAIAVTGAINADNDVRIQTAATTGGSVKVATITAGDNVLLDGGSATTAVEATGAIQATNGDVAVRARDGKAVKLASVTAGDDIVVRTTGAINTTGTITAGGGTDGAGLGDRMIADAGAMTVEGTAFNLTGADIDVVGGQVTLGDTATANGATSDVRVQATGAIGLADAKAGQDILVDGASTVDAANLQAGRDVAVRSTGAGAAVNLISATAGDDIVLRALGDVTVTGTLTATGGTDAAGAGDLLFGAAKTTLDGDLDLAGKTVDIGSKAGSIVVADAINADNDVRLQTTATTGGSVKVSTVTAGDNVLLDGGSATTAVEATGAIQATNGDVAVRARDGKAVKLASVTAGDDIVVRTTGAINTTGTITAGGGTDGAGLGDRMIADAGAMTVEGTAFNLTGADIDVVGGQVTLGDTATANGATSDVRVQATGAIGLADAKAGQDILVDGASTVDAANLQAGRDVAVRSTGAGAAVNLISATAGDDIVLRALGDVTVTGTLTATGGTDAAGAGDLLFGAAKTTLDGDLDLAGKTVDIGSKAGSIVVADAINADNDVRLQTTATTGGSVKVSTVTAGDNVLLDGGSATTAVEATGAIQATNGDVAVRARDGKAVKLASVTAGDDIVVRTTGAINTTGTITAGGGTDGAGLGDRMIADAGAMTVEGTAFNLTGADIDVVGGQVTLGDTATANGATSDVRVQATGAIGLADAKAGQDILVDGASTVDAANLQAGRDVAVRSTGAGAAVNLISATAGDDIVLRAVGDVTVTGTLTATGGTDAAGAGDLLFGAAKTTLDGDLDLAGKTVDIGSKAGSIVVADAINADNDVRLQTTATTGGSVKVSTVTAGDNVLLDGGSATTAVEATGAIQATNGDVAVRARDGKAVKLASVTAGDDIVVRTTGAINTTGTITAGGGTDSAGLGDRMIADAGAMTVEGTAFNLTGADIDVVGGQVTLGDTATANGATSDVRVQATGAIGLADAKAGQDILVDGASTVDAANLQAGRDVAVRSTGAGAAVNLASATAGDDIVLRAVGDVRVSGALSAQGGTDADGAADLLFGAAKSSLNGDFDLAGANVDILSRDGAVRVGQTAASGDVRLTAGQAVVMSGGVQAGRDILASGALVGAAALNAGRDVALRATAGDVSLGSATAGDDIAIRATGGVTVSGELNAAASSAGDGAADRLVRAVGAVTLAGASFDLAGAAVDIKSGGGVALQGRTKGGDVRVQANGGVAVADVEASSQVLLDAQGDVSARTVQAGGDIAVRANGAADLGSMTAGDDLVVRTGGNATLSGPAHAGQGAEVSGVGDLLGGSTGGLSLAGGNIDVASSGQNVVTRDDVTATTDVRLQANPNSGSVSAVRASAGRDVILDGKEIQAGDLTAGQDIAAFAHSGAITLGAAKAGDDLVLRASGDISATGVLSAGTGADGTGAGDRLFTQFKTSLGGDFDLVGGNLDVRAGGAIAMADFISAGTDVRLQTTGSGGVETTGVQAGRDILLDGAASSAIALAADGDIAVRARTGDVSLGTATAGDDLVVRAAGDVSATGALSAGAGPDGSGAGDRLFAQDKTALGGDFDLAGGDLDVRAAGAITMADALLVSTDARLQTTGAGEIVTAGITAGRDIVLDGASVTTGAMDASRDIAVQARSGGVSLDTANAGDDLVIRAAGDVRTTGAWAAGAGDDGDGAGDRLFALDKTALGGDLDLVGGDLDIRARGAINAANSLTARTDVRLQTVGNGAVQATQVQAGRDVLLDGGTVNAGALTAGGDIAVRARSGVLALGTATAGDDLVLRAVQGDVRTTGALSAGAGAEGDGLGDRLFAQDRTALGGDFDLAGGNLDVRAGSAIQLGGDASARTDARLQTVGGGVSTTAVRAGRDILLDGGTVSGGALTAGGDIAVRARDGGITLASASAGDDVVIRATQDVTLAGAISAGGGAERTGTADRLYATDVTKLAGDLDLAGANVDAKTAGAIRANGPVTADRDARFQTSGSGVVATAAMTAGRDILVDAASVSTSDTLKAGGDVALRARMGGVQVASISAGDDIAVRAAGAVEVNGGLSSGTVNSTDGAADRLISTSESGMIVRLVDPNAANAVVEGFNLAAGDIDIRTGGALTVRGALTASGASNLHVQAAGRTSLGPVTVGKIAFVRTGDLALDEAWKAELVRIESTASGGVALGDNAGGASALTLSNAQFNRIDAATVQIFAGDTSGALRGSGITVGALSVDVAKIRTALELYAGGAANVRVVGTLAPSGSTANTTVLRIGQATAGASDWTPKGIQVVADNGGAIGFSTTQNGREFSSIRAFGAVELNATGDILIGYQTFIDKLSTTAAADVANVVRTLTAPINADGPKVLITAGGLTLRANGKIAQQDTSPVNSLTRTGVYLVGQGGQPTQTTILLLGRTSSGTQVLPEFIELYGAVNNGASILANENVALSDKIAFGAGVAPSQYYRLNTCVIFQQGSCTPSGVAANLNIAPERLTALSLVDRTAAAGAADPTVAAATNEEIWAAPDGGDRE